MTCLASEQLRATTLGRTPMLGAMFVEAPVLAIIRTSEPQKVPEIAAALVKGGIRALEISLSVPDALRCIEGSAGDPR